MLEYYMENNNFALKYDQMVVTPGYQGVVIVVTPCTKL